MRLLTATVMTLALSASAQAANVYCEIGTPQFGTCSLAVLRGKIVEGDYARARTMVAKGAITFDLISPGGDVDEAIKIGRLFRKYLITTASNYFHETGNLFQSFGCRSAAECVCASACALIWFGGVERTGSIGLHRPYLNDPRFRQMPAAEATSVYRRILKDVAAYAAEMEIPQSIVEAMVGTSSGDMRWVDHYDRSGIDRPPSIAEWVDATCGRRSQLMEMMKTGKHVDNSRAMALQKSDRDKMFCQDQLFERHRPQLQ
jgi:hypothetical protein